ncbi:ABC transporter ATP-binding protein [Streptomyces pseudovenezuelae]|uniref:ABC-type nitrate/sulfonate/bicarbonate transport system ATPase subunit n=1 Tax=Streptomyces pseudovenezuelae TaxID=67350 RepID=A0ABT6L8W9_9ACTN|nr:ATP-binding cassette domain-containing protein [Streptomyces pseudovenezuelae]MDH6212728.1 ABC-type nitrate/sulfonate/bicarbonate transport system ATPase subunit [Streptomyces pseudovenezuelae]
MSSVRIAGAGKSFGPLEVLRDLELAVEPGEFAAVIGPSGSGKSTLFNLVSGLDRPTSGEVLVEGEPAGVRSGKVAYMPQKDLLFPWRTVLDNTALGLEAQGVRKKEARARADALFADFGLDGFQKAYPAQLSGGMRQRAALLRTVVWGGRSSCWTSRSARSTRSPGPRCSCGCPTCGSATAGRSSWSPTTSGRRSCSRTPCTSCPRAPPRSSSA